MILLILRLLLLAILFPFVGLVAIIICLPRPKASINTSIVGSFIAWFGLRIFNLRIEVRGKENYENLDLPYIVASNHQDSLDVFICGKVCPPHVVSIGKKEILYIPIFGLFYWLSGNILINRNNRSKSHGLIAQVAQRLLNKKEKLGVWIMPEGTRSRDKGFGRFKKGAFHMALAAKCPIVPVSISDYRRLNFKKWNPGVVEVTFHPAMDSSKYNKENIDQFVDDAHQIIGSKI